jgi:hypothetical protein
VKLLHVVPEKIGRDSPVTSPSSVIRPSMNWRRRHRRWRGDTYWAYLTEALGMAVDTLIIFERGTPERALALMGEAADLEDSIAKHPTTPGEVLPVRELYGELLLREVRADEAQAVFEASLERTPNRRNALAGVETAPHVIGRCRHRARLSTGRRRRSAQARDVTNLTFSPALRARGGASLCPA